MTLKESIGIVMELAAENILEESEASKDPEVLEPMRTLQLEALLEVQQFLNQMMGR